MRQEGVLLVLVRANPSNMRGRYVADEQTAIARPQEAGVAAAIRKWSLTSPR
jgi:hypothetical protein